MSFLLHESCEKRWSKNRTLLRSVNGCLQIIYKFLERVGLIFFRRFQIISVIINFVKIDTAKAVLYLSVLYKHFPVRSALLALK
jgi:hypothetical protein